MDEREYRKAKVEVGDLVPECRVTGLGMGYFDASSSWPSFVSLGLVGPVCSTLGRSPS